MISIWTPRRALKINQIIKIGFDLCFSPAARLLAPWEQELEVMFISAFFFPLNEKKILHGWMSELLSQEV